MILRMKDVIDFDESENLIYGPQINSTSNKWKSSTKKRNLYSCAHNLLMVKR